MKRAKKIKGTKKKEKAYETLPGAIHISLQLPEWLHEAMKEIRLARRLAEAADTKLCQIYQEAVEIYVAAGRQQKLVKDYSAPYRRHMSGDFRTK